MDQSNTIGLLRRLKEGDRNSFKILFDLYSPTLFRFSLSYLKCKSTAEDVVQEVFIKIWENRQDLKTDTSFQSYLFTIALNKIRKHFNHISRNNELKHEVLKVLYNMNSQLETHAPYQELITKLNEVISQMPDKRRSIFIKAKFEGKLQREIADELNISLKTVEYHLKEAMKYLKEKFHNHYSLYFLVTLFLT